MANTWVPITAGPWAFDDTNVPFDGISIGASMHWPFGGGLPTFDGDARGNSDRHDEHDEDEWFGRRDRRGSRV